MKRFDVITGLDVCIDLIVSGNVMPEFGQVEKWVGDYAIELGGSASIFISQCAKLGLRTAGIGTRGTDVFGGIYEERLTQAGVDAGYLTADPGQKTGLGICLVEGGDRAILTYNGTIDALAETDFSEERLSQARHLHIASYFLLRRMKSAWPDVVRQAKELGLTVSLDTNWDPENRWEGVDALLPYIDIFLPNRQEAQAFGGVEKLRRLVPVLAVKDGAKGAEVWWKDEHHRMAAHEVRCVDAVGAGDSFDGGFISAYLSGLPVRACLEAACACGSMSVRAAGGTAGQADRVTLFQMLKKRGVIW